MLPSSLDRTLAAVADGDRVLDVGGWAAPLNRADWVIDAMPYESRGALMPGGIGPGPERFGAETWIVRDICDREPFPFEDGFFDFAVCAFVLEDLRDPIWVCEEMSRVAKAGLVEVPSLLEELSWRAPEPSGGPWLGHEHHMWLCQLQNGELEFLGKHHSVHSRRRLRIPRRWSRQLSDEERAITHFWAGELRARERLAITSYPFDELEQAVLERFPPSRVRRAALHLAGRVRHAVRRGRSRLGR